MIANIKYKFWITAVIMFIANAVITVAASTFSADRLEQSILKYIDSNVKLQHETDILSIINDRTFKTDNITASIKHNQELRGITTINIEFRDNERLLDRIKVNIRVKLFAEIPVAAIDLSKGTTINEENIFFKLTDVTDLYSSIVIDKHQIVGKTASEKIFKNSAFTNDKITTEVMISRGEKVEIIAISGAVQIKTFGTAMNDAKSGEMIRVKRSGNSKKIIYGKVSPSGSVIISTSNLYGNYE